MSPGKKYEQKSCQTVSQNKLLLPQVASVRYFVTETKKGTMKLHLCPSPLKIVYNYIQTAHEAYRKKPWISGLDLSLKIGIHYVDANIPKI